MSAARPVFPQRFTHVIALALTVLVFAAAVAFVSWRLRAGLRDQILRREATTLTAVASMQLANEAEELAALGITDAPGQLLAAVLKTSQLRGVLAIRVFDAEQQFAGAVPWVWSEVPPSNQEWSRLVSRLPQAQLHAPASRTELTDLVPAQEPGEYRVPLLECWVPLSRMETDRLAGAAQFWIDGRGLAGEFSALDRRLITQATLAWLAGSILILLTLGWALRRLAAANQQLRDRSNDLEQANRELVLAAKTSALGTVTAHLIHELKNPLAGLEIFVANQADGSARDQGEELASASALTRRLRTMVNDVVGVLRDEQSGTTFTLTSAEVVEIALEKVALDAKARGVKIETVLETDKSLSARRANLAGLVLRNLLQNALEAASRDEVVRVTTQEAKNGDVVFIVEDQGPGLPTAVRARLFQPCTSTKAGGSGIGLALSHQLAQQAGGSLELARSDERGTSFRLVLAMQP